MAHDDSAALISDAFVDDVRGLQAELFEATVQVSCVVWDLVQFWGFRCMAY